jgi:DNA-binding NarL/FixJ family response regulator
MTPMLQPYCIVLVDDHEMFRREVKKLIEELAGLKVIGEAGDGRELFQLLKRSNPHLVVLDISMPHFRAMEATRQIKVDYPGVKVLILVMDQAQEYLAQAAAAGAEGCLLKQEAGTKLAPAIEAIRRGGNYLFPFS